MARETVCLERGAGGLLQPSGAAMPCCGHHMHMCHMHMHMCMCMWVVRPPRVGGGVTPLFPAQVTSWVTGMALRTSHSVSFVAAAVR